MTKIKHYPTQTVKVDDIKLDGTNPNIMDKKMTKRLSESMKEFGNTQDIIVDANTMYLADGEHRLKEYIDKGIKEIPVKLIPFKDDAHRRAFRQAANKIHGEHQDELDIDEYQKIIEGDKEDLLEMATGHTFEEISMLIDIPAATDTKETKKVEKLGHLEIKCPHCGKSFKKGEADKSG